MLVPIHAPVPEGVDAAVVRMDGTNRLQGSGMTEFPINETVNLSDISEHFSVAQAGPYVRTRRMDGQATFTNNAWSPLVHPESFNRG